MYSVGEGRNEGSSSLLFVCRLIFSPTISLFKWLMHLKVSAKQKQNEP